MPFSFSLPALPQPIATTEPSEFPAGDTVQFRKALADYPATAGWVLWYYLRGISGLAVQATAEGDDFLVTFAADKTANLAPGSYKWVARVERGGEVYTVGDGRMTVTPDFKNAPDGALRSHAEKMLDLCTRALEKRVPLDQKFYTLINRTATREELDVIRKMRAYYAHRVWRERNGMKLGPAVTVGFTRPGGAGVGALKDLLSGMGGGN